MSIKRYYAYVTFDMAIYFEERLNSNDKIKRYSRTSAMSEEGEHILRYDIEAEEGVIDPKWELKAEDGVC